jgi:hypothetical protein
MKFSRTLPLIALAGLAVNASAQVNVNLVAKVGDALDGSTITGLGQAFVSGGTGKVGFLATLADGSRSVWFDTGSVFNSADDDGVNLSGGEGTIGVSDTGGFIYSPSFNDEDAVWTQAGLLLVADQPIPGTGLFSSFNSRPTMRGNGEAFWVGGYTAAPGGSTQGRMLLRGNPDDPSSITVVNRTGDLIGGFAIGTTGVGFNYQFSNNGANYIQQLILDTGSTLNDGVVAVNGNIVMREGDATGEGDNWQTFRQVSINDSGNFVISGDTNASSTTDDFIYSNGAIQLRAGQSLDGRTLGSTVDASAINNNNQVAFIWDTDLGETLFVGDYANLGASLAYLSTGDMVDVDNDGIADYTILDFNPSTTITMGLDFGDNNLVYVSVEVRDVAGGEYDAIIGIPVPAPAGLGLAALAGLLTARRRR